MPTNSKTSLKTIVDFARRKGLVFPSSEIYGGFAATYDFGPLGILLKKNIEQAWRYWNVTSRTDMVEIEGAIFMHPKVWEASGHIGGFSDLLVEDTVTRKRYRADHLVEDAKVVWPLNNQSDNIEFKVLKYEEKYQSQAREIIQEGWIDSVILEIDKELILENCKRLSYPQLLDINYQKFVILKNETVVGYLCLEKKTDKEYFVSDFYIKKEFRRRGVGKQLFNNGLEYMKQQFAEKVSLYLDDSNTRAGNFYKYFGFIEDKQSEFNWLDKNGNIVATNPEHLMKLQLNLKVPINQTLVFTVHGGNSSGVRTDDGIPTREIIKNQYSTADDKSVWSENLDVPLNSAEFVSINPLFPNPTEANYNEWARFLEQVLGDSKYSGYTNLILVGHSLGTVFLQRYLAENNIQSKFGNDLQQLHLVGCCTREGDFETSSNWQGILEQVEAKNIFLYHSKDDQVCNFAEAEIYNQHLLGCNFGIFEGRGHFEQAQLPELVENIKITTTPWDPNQVIPFIQHQARNNLNKIWPKAVIAHFQKLFPADSSSIESKIRNLFKELLVEDLITALDADKDEYLATSKFLEDSVEPNLSQVQVNEIEQEVRGSSRDLIVDCFIVNDRGQILTQKRSASRRLYPNCWDLPGGHVDEGDTVWNTILKEVKEELNLEVESVVKLFDKVELSIPSDVAGESENTKKLILQFIVTVRSLEGIRLETGKADEFKWIDQNNLEILKENRQDEGYGFYIHDSVKKVLDYCRQNSTSTILTNAGPLAAEEIDKIITYYNLKSPDGNPLSGAKKFNLMVKTHLGPVEDETSVVYLKGESCQNIYLDWKAVQETTRRKLPFGIAQIGKAFRNEITVKQFMFRTREFEQMDVQYFVKPGTEDNHYAYFKQNRWDFYTQALNISSDNLKFRQHDKDELVFYAKEAWDVEYNFGENGFKELEGIHNRTDYDTKQHSKFSGQDLTYFDSEDNSRYLPYIVETSAGFNRMFLAIMFEFYSEQQLTTEKGETETRIVLQFPHNLAPFKLAILPLMKKDGLGEYAFELYSKLRKSGISCDYDEAGSIGKRYRRQDENGTPYCVCVDYQTLEDNTVTVRDRDTMEQRRVGAEELNNLVK